MLPVLRKFGLASLLSEWRSQTKIPPMLPAGSWSLSLLGCSDGSCIARDDEDRGRHHIWWVDPCPRVGSAADKLASDEHMAERESARSN